MLDRRGAERIVAVGIVEAAHALLRQAPEAVAYRQAQAKAARAFQEEQTAFVIACELVGADPSVVFYDAGRKALMPLPLPDPAPAEEMGAVLTTA